MDQASAVTRKEHIVSVYNITADTYDRNRAIQICAARLLALAALQPGERVLDVACGTGNVALGAAEAVGPGGHVTGIDLTEAMLDRARDKARERSLSNVELHVGDAERTGIGDASFDVVTCGLAMQYMPTPPSVAAEWHRMLRPGGRVVFSTWNQGFGSQALRGMLNALLAEYGLAAGGAAPGAEWARDPEACRNLLEDAGFTDATVRTEQHGFYFASPEEYWDEDVVASTASAQIARLRPQQLEQVKARHLEEIAATATPQGIWREGAVNFILGRRAG